jgi:hypothetical protein
MPTNTPPPPPASVSKLPILYSNNVGHVLIPRPSNNFGFKLPKFGNLHKGMISGGKRTRRHRTRKHRIRKHRTRKH